MPGVIHYLQQGDGLTQAVAVILLLMSILTWCLVFGKAWMLVRVRRRVPAAMTAFWEAKDAREGLNAMQRIDTERLATGLAQAVLDAALPSAVPRQTTAGAALNAAAEPGERLTRYLRQSLLRGQRQLESGLALLATMASVAPFIGLLGTVWGIYHALLGVAGSSTPALADVAGPVGEALIMTAFGLVVAIPAAVAYNLLGRLVRARADDLDGFARDLQTFFSRTGG